MKNKKLVTLLAMATVASCLFSACGFGPKEEEEDPTVVVEETPTPAPTVAPAATPTPVPQTTKYTAANKSISIDLPDSSWSNKMDEGDTISFESTAGDRILILHGKGEEAMSEVVLPDTRDNAAALTASADVVEGTDFEIKDYKAEEKNGANVYSYTVQYLNTDKGGGYTSVENYVIANDQEFYSLAGSVKTDTALAGVKKSFSSFVIQDAESTLRSASSSTGTGTSGTNSNGTSNTTTGNDNTTGSDDANSSSAGSDSGSTSSGNDSYTGGSSYNPGYSNMDLYTSSGVAFGIWQDGSGNWIDGDGNTFWFDENGVAYDQYGNAYSAGDSYGDYYGDYDYSYDESYDNGYTDNSGNYYGGSMDLYTSSGVAFGIYQDANGNWIDGDGNTFWFDSNGVAYDQNGNSYGQ